jgi:hypothetical protein
MQPELVCDIVDVEETVNLMTNALDMYCDKLIGNTKNYIIHPETIEMELEAVITTTLLENNPHLKDKFKVTFSREEGEHYALSISIHKSVVQQHLEDVTMGSRLCH